LGGYPSIFLKTAAGEIRKYDGAREVKDLVKYLAKHVTHKFDEGTDHDETTEKQEKKEDKKHKKDKKDKKEKKKDKKHKKEKEEL